MIDPIDPPSDSYSERQAQYDRKYMDAWKDAPEAFKKDAALLGLHPNVEERAGEALEYDETRRDTPIVQHEDRFGTGSFTPDMAAMVDTHVDVIIENHAKFFAGSGIETSVIAQFIRLIADKLQKPMEEELYRHRALLLGRVLAYLIADENGNVLSRIHALLHSVPRLATINGYPSMRASAKKCGVSPEWLRRSRDRACIMLGVQAPADGVKSAEAKAKYTKNANTNHWRNQRFKPESK